MQLIVFRVATLKCGIPLTQVDSVEFAAEVTVIPNTPPIVSGFLDYHGQILPVLRVGERFGLEETPMQLSDRLIRCRSRSQFHCLLWVNEVTGSETLTDESIQTPEIILQALPHLKGVSGHADDLLLIHDLDQFLSVHEQMQLQKALTELEQVS